MVKKNKFQYFWTILKNNNNFLIVSHFNPDGDAVSSTVALYRFLKQEKKKVDIYNANGHTKTFQLFLKKDIILNTFKKKSYEAIFVLDCGDLSRTKIASELKTCNIPIINIDHHKTNTYFGTYNIVNKTAKATAEILFDIIDSHNKLTKSTAEILLYGMMTDTLILQTPNITSDFLKKIYHILSLGVSFPKTIEPILYSKSLEDIKNLETGIRNITYNKKKTILWSFFSKNIIKQNPSIVWKTEILKKMLSIKSAQIVFLLAYKEKNKTLLELRSKKNYDVSKIALELNGGGHKNASGAVIDAQLKQAKKIVLKKILAYYPQLF